MKRSIASSVTSLFALLIVLAGTVHAQRSPSDGIRESNDPDRAAEVELKAEAISGRRIEGSGESGEEASETTEPGTTPSEARTLGEERGEGESGGTQESDKPPSQVQPLPESSGESDSEAPYGGVGNEEKPNKRSPADLGDVYH